MGYFSVPKPIELDPGADGQVQFNDAGSMGGNKSLIFEKRRNRLVTRHLRAKGMLITGQNRAPRARDLAKGELAFWFHPQSASLRFVAKNQQGEVIAGTVQANVIL